MWNGLDADATVVHVLFERNNLGGIEVVTVEDNGHGLPYDNVGEAFSNLGGSWKRDRSKTAGGRILHGKQGKGRFQAFALGSRALWTSRFSGGGPMTEYTIRGDRSRMDRFEVDDPRPSTQTSTGMVVRVNGVDRPVASLDGDRARQTLNEEFALYLHQYSAVKIMYDGQPLDPSTVEERVADYSVGGVRLKDGSEGRGELTIVEWSVPTERALFLCDENGFAFSKVPVGIQAPSFVFTAYLRSSLLRELNEGGYLQLDELQPDLKQLLDAAKEKMREHFRRRAAEEARGLVEQWRKEEVYPYLGTPEGPIEEAERQVFDVMALNVHEYLPDFGESSKENKRMSFRLLRTALETKLPGKSL
jgi:hypothetical protein